VNKLGKLPAKHDPRTLRLSKYLALPTAPDPIDWGKAVTVPWGMYMNGPDPLNPPAIAGGVGDCFWAGMAHALMTWTANAGGIFVPTNNDVEVGYESTGFDPSNPSATDNGTVLLDGLKYMRTTGIGGKKIGAFVAVDWKNHAEVMAALYLFGVLLIGVQFPQDWESSDVWDTTSSPLVGGHFIPGVKGSLAAALLEIISWGRGYTLTFAGLDQNCDEMYVTLPPEWIEDNGKAPNGFDMQTLTADLAAVAS